MTMNQKKKATQVFEKNNFFTSISTLGWEISVEMQVGEARCRVEWECQVLGRRSNFSSSSFHHFISSALTIRSQFLKYSHHSSYLMFSFQSGVFQNGNGRIHGGRHVSTTSYEQVTINLLLVLHYVLLLLLHLLLLHHPHVAAHQALLRRTGAKLPTPSELLIECPSALPPCPFIRLLPRQRVHRLHVQHNDQHHLQQQHHESH